MSWQAAMGEWLDLAPGDECSSRNDCVEQSRVGF